jgi:hypothetical protein
LRTCVSAHLSETSRKDGGEGGGVGEVGEVAGVGGEPMWGRSRGPIRHGSMRGSYYDYSGRDKWPFARPYSDHWKYARRNAEKAAVQAEILKSLYLVGALGKVVD